MLFCSLGRVVCLSQSCYYDHSLFCPSVIVSLCLSWSLLLALYPAVFISGFLSPFKYFLFPFLLSLSRCLSRSLSFLFSVSLCPLFLSSLCSSVLLSVYLSLFLSLCTHALFVSLSPFFLFSPLSLIRERATMGCNSLAWLTYHSVLLQFIPSVGP